ncbi:carboxymuconolactone decarboxylase family protein [Fusobacterium sp. PH5-44]|uniref:carboxymuconolactone decarboxylase family protein n=1 Tax=unclassified Fusobacterium TaxID=2648384 RepID=UPI003D1EE121
MKVSNAYEFFQKEAPKISKAWHDFVIAQGNISKLDKKTHSLAYLSVLSAVRLESGIPFHVKMSKANGASRDEVISAVLVGLPAVGNIVTSSVSIAVKAYDE